jgi:hypothetical protein
MVGSLVNNTKKVEAKVVYWAAAKDFLATV